MTIVYKIYRKTDGLFSMGGSSPRFSKTGKVWKQKGHLTNHLNQVDLRLTRGGKHIYSDCEIIPYELKEVQTGPGFTIEEYLMERNERLAQQEAERQERMANYQKEQRRQLYEQLKHEFNPVTGDKL